MKIEMASLSVGASAVLRILCWTLLSAQLVSGGISCLGNPCVNGICIDDVNSTYSCYCVDGYTGVQCQTNWDECWSDPCLNGGTCVDGVASYNCTCPDGFIGENCETNFNECESNPCMNNGTCIDLTNGYVCSCVPGFSGEHCELDIAVCNSSDEVRCYNGGQCIEGPGFKFYCKCLSGWAGPSCEDQIDECESSPCQNGGVCIDVHADYMCACPYGFTGKSCEIRIEFCDENTCSNGALCVLEEGTPACYCVPDYHGERCELQYDECLLGPRCMNGGTCIDGVDNFTCSCPPKLTGTFCECLILDDKTFDCEYVSPTPLTEIKHTLLMSIGNLNTDLSSVFSSDFNSTTPISTMQTDSWSSTTALTVDLNFNMTTEESMSMSETSPADISTNNTTITPIEDITITIPTASSNTTEAVEQETTVSVCVDNCATPVDTTARLPTENLEISTEVTIETTTTTEKLLTTINERTESNILPVTEQSTESSTESDTTTSETTKEITVEITPTPKGDITTERMFTDSPTEHIMTDAPTPSVLITTEAMDVTTRSDNVTYSYTTIQSECTDSMCNYHGICLKSVHGIRCHCNFNYAGKFCDQKTVIVSAAFSGNSYITHKLQNSSSIAVEFNAKTLITDGQIMHVDIADGVYMQLFMSSGLLKFKFSCGYQTMLLSELKTFVNKGYLMKIETRLDLYFNDQQCNATLRLNNTVAMSGGQVANITTLEPNATLYLGNNPNYKDTDSKPFVGCISNLKVNGEHRDVFGDALEAGDVAECSSLACLSSPCLNGGTCSDQGTGYICSCSNGWSGRHCGSSVCDNNPCRAGGSCVRHPATGFLCLCPYGKHGMFCEYNVDITRPSLAPISTGISSYMIYPLSSAAQNSDRFDLRLRFQTTDMDQIALLAFIGQAGRHDSKSQHLALTFVKGYIMLTWNMGSGARRIFSGRAVGGRHGGHSVRVWRRGRSAGLELDAALNVSGNARADRTHMNTLPYIYIGGHPSQGFEWLPHDLPLHGGWRGCVWEVRGAAVGGAARGGRGVGQCSLSHCSAAACTHTQGVCLHSPATYGCICNDGWFGATCSSKTNPCDRNYTLCQGRCVINADGSECDCPYGKTGLNCSKDLIPTDVLFTGIRSYVKLYPRVISSVSVSFEAEIKPTKERGLLLFVQTPHFYASLSLQGGLLEFRWTDVASGVSSVVRSGVVSRGAWAAVRAGRYGGRLYARAHQALVTHALHAQAYPHTKHNATLWIGGTQDLAMLPFDVMSGPPEPYSGCIRNLYINNILIPFEQQNIEEGQNLLDCDGTPCGVEACPGGKCVLDNGIARCVCGDKSDEADKETKTDGGDEGNSGGKVLGGARCRRQAECSQATCVPPAGNCRRGRCVCAAGYDGTNCETKINVTIPEFNGDSVLSVGGGRVRGSLQRAGTRSQSSYFALNFTTPEPDGLLLWLQMGIGYLGVGLENGILKLVWSIANKNLSHYNNDVRMYGKVQRLVPHAGELSDAEWHPLVVRLQVNNITVTVDQVVAYVEEPGFNSERDYEDTEMYIGGINEENSTIAKKIFPHNFKGCIDHIATREEKFITNFTEVYSENIKMCQLFSVT